MQTEGEIGIAKQNTEGFGATIKQINRSRVLRKQDDLAQIVAIQRLAIIQNEGNHRDTG